jgi:hypothetical protein
MLVEFFKPLGANIDDIPILWVCSSMTGLIIQPIIGYFQTELGQRRRKPYFWLSYISFGCIIHYAQFSCIVVCSWNVTMDASINVSMEPFEPL